MEVSLERQEMRLYWLMGLLLVGCAVLGVVIQGPTATFRGLATIQYHPARLLNDFTVVGGEGAALLNAALVALLGLLLVKVHRVRLSGPTIAAIFTMFGFGLFGKTPTNALPIIAGVAFAARISEKSFQEYILMALFGTALGPLVMALAVEAGLAPPIAVGVAIVGGFAAGVLLPPLGITMLRLHQGFNLYNIGLTCGFLAIFAASLLVATGRPFSPTLVWNDAPSPVLVFLVPALALVLLVAGLIPSPKKTWADFRKILTLSGRLPSDFLTMASTRGSLFNMGVMGLVTWGYVLAVGGDLNGPVLGGILTAMGFASFGKHPRNGWPVVAGVVAACLLFGKDLAAPGPLLAALFSLTLAPLAGEFGVFVGFIAGFLHLVMVERTGAWHLGTNLYNNGFSGGLTATFLVAVIEWYRSNHSAERTRMFHKTPKTVDTGSSDVAEQRERPSDVALSRSSKE
ncbi:MAG: DUF1576 domain-containing protein [Spirochaetales bacterium]|nr:DUF1576 domain-containing protein [Spirochaetales bacterium]